MVRERSGHDSSFPCSSCRLPAEISTGPSRERSRSLGTQIACHKERGHVAPPAAISLVSASALAYEVLLTRLFSIVQWHHFAYMAISIALLGYGASGSFLALFQDRLRPRFTAVFALSAALFGVSAVAGFALAQRLPFNALAVIWEPRQLLYLVAYYLLFATPFFCAAICVGLAFAAFPNHIARVYRYDMLGAGLGALGVIAALFWLFPSQALRVVGGLGFLAAALASWQEVVANRRISDRRRARLCGSSHLLDGTALLGVQGACSGTPDSRDRSRSRGIEPARPLEGHPQSADPASLCPRSEPQQLHRAAATAWCLHRWRGSQPDHRL